MTWRCAFVGGQEQPGFTTDTDGFRLEVGTNESRYTRWGVGGWSSSECGRISAAPSDDSYKAEGHRRSLSRKAPKPPDLNDAGPTQRRLLAVTARLSTTDPPAVSDSEYTCQHRMRCARCFRGVVMLDSTTRLSLCRTLYIYPRGRITRVDVRLQIRPMKASSRDDRLSVRMRGRMTYFHVHRAFGGRLILNAKRLLQRPVSNRQRLFVPYPLVTRDVLQRSRGDFNSVY